MSRSILLSRLGSRLAAVAVLAATSACFYVEPINERPGANIEQTGDPPKRGGEATVEAIPEDPDGDFVFYAWSAWPCSSRDLCDVVDRIGDADNDEQTWHIDIPLNLADGNPVRGIQVELQITDRYGAVSTPNPRLYIDVTNNAPTGTILDPRGDDRFEGTFPVGTPIYFSTTSNDPDRDPVTLAWTVKTAPRNSSQEDRIFALAETGEQLLVPDVHGQWTVTATFSDGFGGEKSIDKTIDVAEDAPPCILATDPTVPALDPLPAFPLDAPRRFAVLSIDDDRDTYPGASPDSPYYGTSTFTWSLASAADGGEHSVLVGNVGASVDLDPAHFARGDQLELRVEITDRQDRELNCDPSRPTCSITGSTTCLQRLSWRMDIP